LWNDLNDEFRRSPRVASFLSILVVEDDTAVRDVLIRVLSEK